MHPQDTSFLTNGFQTHHGPRRSAIRGLKLATQYSMEAADKNMDSNAVGLNKENK